MNGTQPTSTGVLCWPKRLLSADDLRRHLNGQRELVLLPRTIVTPLAADELRAKGVRISWEVPQAKEAATTSAGTWAYAQEKPDPMIASVLQALARDGVILAALDVTASPAWERTIAEAILRAGHIGGIVFCSDPALLCCIANKLAGMRAASVSNVVQTMRAQKNLGANLFAIETAGRTFFEIRQMLKTMVTGAAACPGPIANVLKELDGHAHR